MKLIAHRGGMAVGETENTLATMQRSIEFGVHGIEVDLRTTADGVIVVMHDADLDRTTNGRGHVHEQTWADLNRLRTGRRDNREDDNRDVGEFIPTFDDVLRLVRRSGTHLLLDIKRHDALDHGRIMDMLEQQRLVAAVTLGVRRMDDLVAFKTRAPAVSCLALTRTPDELADYVERGADAVRLWTKWLRAEPDLLQRAQSSGKPVWVTAGAPSAAEIHELVDSGVDAILVDDPEFALGVLSSR